jgi:hypothetical protein
VRKGNSGASRLLSGGSESGAASSVTTTNPVTSKFTYVYKEDGNKKKLLRREAKPTGFKAFAGEGHSLKSDK